MIFFLYTWTSALIIQLAVATLYSRLQIFSDLAVDIIGRFCPTFLQNVSFIYVTKPQNLFGVVWRGFTPLKAYLVRLPCLAKAGGSMRPLFFAFFSVFKMATKLLKAKFMPVQKLGEKCFSFNLPFYQLKRRKDCPLINECER